MIQFKKFRFSKDTQISVGFFQNKFLTTFYELFSYAVQYATTEYENVLYIFLTISKKKTKYKRHSTRRLNLVFMYLVFALYFSRVSICISRLSKLQASVIRVEPVNDSWRTTSIISVTSVNYNVEEFIESLLHLHHFNRLCDLFVK